MFDGAKVELVGRLGRDPETRYTPAGALYISFSMAVSKKWEGRDGQSKEQTSWFKVMAWKALAEQLDQAVNGGTLRKGSRVQVIGSLDIRDWTDQQGGKRTSAEVVAFEVNVEPGRAAPAVAQVTADGQLDYSDVPF